MKSVRRRLRARQAASDGALALSVGATLALCVLLAAAGLGPAGRTLAWALLGGAGAQAAFFALRPLWRWRTDDEVARLVGELGGLGDLPLTAVELARDLASGQQLSSPALVRATIAHAESACARLAPDKLVDLAPARRRSLLVLGVAAAWAISLVAMPGRIGQGWQTMQEKRAPGEITSEPLVADVDVELAFPSYTKLSPRVLRGTSGDVLAPRGTIVTLHARPLAPVKTAELRFDGKDAPVAVALEGGNLVARFTALDPGGYRFALRSPAGTLSLEAESHRVEIEPDRAPHIELRAPSDEVEVKSARAKIQLEYAADDDYGVGSIDLVWRVVEKSAKGNKAEKSKVHKVHVADGKDRKALGDRFDWDLADVDLAAGARVEFFLEAADLDDQPAPNVGRSKSYFVHRASPEQKHDEMIEREAELAEAAVKLLADRIDAESIDDETETALEARALIHIKTETFVAQLQELTKLVAGDALAPVELKPSLVEMLARLGRIAGVEDEDLRELRERAQVSARELTSLRLLAPRFVVEMENDTLRLADLVARQRLDELAMLGNEISKSRDRLKDLLEKYKASRSDTVKKEIERELDELQRRLAELQQKASKLEGEVPDEYLNREAMDDKDMQSQLDAIRDKLQKGDVDGALAEMRKMSQALDGVREALDNEAKNFRDERFSAEQKALAEMENEVADLEHDEREIARETDELQQRTSPEQDRRNKEKAEAAAQRLKSQVQELVKKLAEIDGRSLDSRLDRSAHERLDKARRDAGELERALGQGELGEARSLAHDAVQQLDMLAERLQAAEQMELWASARSPVRRARQEVREVGELAQKLADALDDAMPRSDENLSREDREQLGKLQERQRAVRRRLDEAMGKAQRRSQSGQSPMSGEGAQQMGEAGAHMDGAHQRLGDGEPRGALTEEQAAIEQLGGLKKKLSDARHPPQSSSAQMDKERVEIPGADQYKAPREFRDQLMDAMKRPAPDAYRERVKKFYEEIAR